MPLNHSIACLEVQKCRNLGCKSSLNKIRSHQRKLPFRPKWLLSSTRKRTIFQRGRFLKIVPVILLIHIFLTFYTICRLEGLQWMQINGYWSGIRVKWGKISQYVEQTAFKILPPPGQKVKKVIFFIFSCIITFHWPQIVIFSQNACRSFILR